MSECSHSFPSCAQNKRETTRKVSTGGAEGGDGALFRYVDHEEFAVDIRRQLKNLIDDPEMEVNVE